MKLQGHKVKLITDYRDLFSKYTELPQNQDPTFNFIIFDNTTEKKHIRYYREEDIKFDKVIISKVFTDTPIPSLIKHLAIVEYGGTGFFYDKATPLPKHIEHHKPDYSLYNEWVLKQIENGVKPKDLKYYTDYSIGFTTRGCFRKCGFCVNKQYDKVELHSPIDEFLEKDRRNICLLDDNILGYNQWESIFKSLRNTKKKFEYNQGMDLRLMTDEKAKILNESKYIGDYIFAFDHIKDRNLIEKNLMIWKKHSNKTTKLYVLCAYDSQDELDIANTFERIKILMKYGCLSYIMRYSDYKNAKYKGMYINLARWCNQPNFYKKKSFRQFCEINGDKSATMKYLREFENDYPCIAKEYFDIRFEDMNKLLK